MNIRINEHIISEGFASYIKKTNQQFENESLPYSIATESRPSVVLKSPSLNESLPSAHRSKNFSINQKAIPSDLQVKKDPILCSPILLTEAAAESDSSQKLSIMIHMAGSKYYSLNQLCSTITEQEYIKPSVWKISNIKKKLNNIFLKCFNTHELTPQYEEKVRKLTELADLQFDLSKPSHSDIFYNYYLRLGFGGKFEETPENWLRIGFSSGDIKSNELSQKRTILNLLFLIFILEKNSEIFRIAYALSEEFKQSPIGLTNMIINGSLALLKRKKLNEIFNADEVIANFFELHAGVLIFWFGLIKDFGLQKSIKKAVKKAENSPNQCRLAYLNYRNKF